LKYLHQHYKDVLNPVQCSFLEDEIDTNKVAIFDSSTISLFVDIFKGAGRNSLTGKKKGGLKIHTTFIDILGKASKRWRTI